jgi:hydrogenase expression/formation protein HypE
MVAVVDGPQAPIALEAMRAHPLGHEATIVGEVTEEHAGLVLEQTAFGGSRVVDMLTGDPLPRIC